MNPVLLPPPKRLRLLAGCCASHATVVRIPSPLPGRAEPEAYRLTVGKREIRIQASTPGGFFYAEKTLAQLRAQAGLDDSLPQVDVLDWPDFPIRGLYHDVTRGKVPKLRTLLALAETCASLKLNQLQLYVEHTFAFRHHPEVWRGADPLTPDDIRALDARCAELHIDLVPSFSTFGHCYTWIREKFPELNEFETDVSTDAFCWSDRMLHYTLNPSDPRSLALVREIIAETRPLFRSRLYNICCDETFDLGLGKNRAKAARVGKGRLYVDFLKAVMGIVREHDATPMFWGDIIGHHPELLGEIPTDAVCLDWDYSAALENTKGVLFQAAARPFYVCPGVQAWNRWLPDYRTAHTNITGLARHGLATGAVGLLNTDWGDYGHINTLGPTLVPIALGAAAAWHTRSSQLAVPAFNRIASRLLLGDPSGRLQGLLTAASAEQRALWYALCLGIQRPARDMPDDSFEPRTGLAKKFFEHKPAVHRRAYAALERHRAKITAHLARCPELDPLIATEIQISLHALVVMEAFALHAAHAEGKTRSPGPLAPAVLAAELRRLRRDLRKVWLRRNHRSEFDRIAEVLSACARLALRRPDERANGHFL